MIVNFLLTATCSVFGDPHYQSFDGKMFDYQGKCGHVMVSDYCPNSRGLSENIRVEVKTTTCGSQDVTCTREVTTTIHGTVFKMVHGSPKVRVSSSNSTESVPDYKLYEHAGAYVQIVTKHGISLLWDNGTRLYIKVGPSHIGKVCGLCGNYDGSEANDFQTFQGDIAGNAISFGDSWRSETSCPLTKEVKDTCKARPHRLDPSKRACAIIKSDKFASCHSLVDPLPYYDRCVFDACGCDTVGDCDCLCAAVSAYATECLNEGVAINWKKGHKICGMCNYFFLFSQLIFKICFGCVLLFVVYQYSHIVLYLK